MSAERGSVCELACDKLTDECGETETYAECLPLCEDSVEPLIFSCGSWIDCAYNGACTRLPSSVCGAQEFRCTERQCIDADAVCGSTPQCGDPSDEGAVRGQAACASDQHLCEGTCASCPTDQVVATACEAGTCVATECEEGAFTCETGCCT